MRSGRPREHDRGRDDWCEARKSLNEAIKQEQKAKEAKDEAAKQEALKKEAEARKEYARKEAERQAALAARKELVNRTKYDHENAKRGPGRYGGMGKDA